MASTAKYYVPYDKKSKDADGFYVLINIKRCYTYVYIYGFYIFQLFLFTLLIYRFKAIAKYDKPPVGRFLH